MTKTPEELYFERMMQEYTTRWEGCPYVLGSIKGITALSLANCDGYEAGYNAAWDEWRAGKLFQNQEHADAVYKEAAEDQLADAGKVMFCVHCNDMHKGDCAEGKGKNHAALRGTQWISVKERLPEINQEVLISYGKKPFLLVAFLYHPQYPKKDVKVFCGTNNTNYSLEYVTHWMPLPEPPKEEK